MTLWHKNKPDRVAALPGLFYKEILLFLLFSLRQSTACNTFSSVAWTSILQCFRCFCCNWFWSYFCHNSSFLSLVVTYFKLPLYTWINPIPTPNRAGIYSLKSNVIFPGLVDAIFLQSYPDNLPAFLMVCFTFVTTPFSAIFFKSYAEKSSALMTIFPPADAMFFKS